jgi:hypothetical protein
MLSIDAAARRFAAMVETRRGVSVASGTFFLGLLAGAGLTAQLHEWWITSLSLCSSSSAGLRQVNRTQLDLVFAITLYPVTNPVGQIAVLAVAVAALIGFLLWSSDVVVNVGCRVVTEPQCL